jgi:senataxin
LDKQNRGAPHCLARIHGLKTEAKRGARSLVIEYKISPKNSAMIPGKDTVLHIVKLTHMATIEREYATLQALQFYDLRDEILSAKASPILKYGDQAVQSFMGNYNLNPGQAKAVLGAKDNDGFTLIQGPPGTGKTKTIIAMVGCLLTGSLGASARPVANAANATNGNGAMKKLLVCAPSNAAVDELVLRLKQGVKSAMGSFHKISVIRLGRSDIINSAVKDVSLDELVNKRLEELSIREKTRADIDKLHSDAGEIRDTLMQLRSDLQIARDADDRDNANRLQREIDKVVKQQISIGNQIDNSKKEDQSVNRMVEIKRQEIQQDILSKAHVLCATLSGSGHDMFKKLENVDFETVIIDEAAQCVELSALIPLKYGALKCILVGDPKQLPPTVLSQSAARFGYDQSLFVRMQRNHPTDIHLLDTQYRMHPLISLFPSNTFYDGRLVDGDDMAALRKQPWHASSLFGPYRFFDVKGVQAKGHRGQSLINVEELNVAMQLYERLRSDYRNVDFKRKIGIITPYKAQLFELRTRFTHRYGEDIFQEIEFNTTDAFQGRECEIIIFSCVRANPKGGIGFMTDIRRMNVGLTRAKSSLWILGDSDALSQGEFWSKLVDDARRRNLYTAGNVMALLRRPTEKNSMDWEPPSRTVAPPVNAPVQPTYTQEVAMHDAPPQGPPGLAGGAQQGTKVPEWAHSKRLEGLDGRGLPVGESQPSKFTERPAIQSSTGPVGRPSDVPASLPRKRTSEGPLPGGHDSKRVCRISSAETGYGVDEVSVASQKCARDRQGPASWEEIRNRPGSSPKTTPKPSAFRESSTEPSTSTSAGGSGRYGDPRPCSSPTPSADSGSEPDDEFYALLWQFDEGKLGQGQVWYW